ncbi:hypothetical protein, partial [Salmonella enterica]|uniref:hypothetical protein n=1 Tax=Salmonella enterica TaxID=28901 RepID=UPI001F47657E
YLLVIGLPLHFCRASAQTWSFFQENAGKSGKCGRHHTGLLGETVNAITFICALVPAAHFPVSNETVGL